METSDFFSYAWHQDEDETDRTVIRIYGLNAKNENVCIIVNNFTPYVYIELPDVIEWDASKAQLVANKIDQMLKDRKPIVKQLMFKKRLYYAKLDKKGRKRLFPYLFCCFSHQEDIRQLGYKIRRPMRIIGVGTINVKMHEHNASPILQLTSLRKIPTAGWIKFSGKRIKKEDQATMCDREYKVKWKNLVPIESDDVARPLIMGYDIEVNSTIPSAMPKSERPGDKIFQISCVFARQGAKEEAYVKMLLTLGTPDFDFLDDTEVLMYETEHDLLLGFTELIQEKQPNVIIGYNIFTFDIPYMIDRAKQLYCIYDFDRQGFDKYSHARERVIKWSSSAYKNQAFQFLDAEGRIFVDLLPLVKRDYKMSNYKLKTISAHFLKGQTKDPLDPKGIFKCYRLGMKGGRKGERALGLVGRYCVQDSLLVVKLFETLTTWVALCEMSKVTNVPIFALYTQGQQLKVFSQVYRKCTHENTVIEKDGYTPGENDHYVGATVFPPIPGVYDKVVPFDFSSLYPTTIIAYNISWDTLVPNESDIPDDLCHIMIWEDHIGCAHDPKEIRKAELNKIIKERDADVKELRRQRDLKKNKGRKEEFKIMIAEEIEKTRPLREERSTLQKSKPKHKMCCKRRFRWLKEPMGVLPEILTHLLDTRKATKKIMKATYKELKGIDMVDKRYDVIKTKHEVLDKRQLALKVSANSAYGAMGVQRGYLPLMPGAMCTTYKGRMAVQQAADSIQNEHKGKLIYGDTDCLTGETPVLLKWTESSKTKICYRTIETISAGNWTRINANKEISDPLPGYQVWSDQGFTKIVNIVRCNAVKPLSRVVVHTGEVTCSNEHSLLREDLSSVTPLDIKLNDSLCIAEPPLPDDTPTEPKYLTAEKIQNYKIPEIYLYGVSAELMFVWGVFFTDGSCEPYVQKTMRTWAINNRDRKLLEKCMEILQRYESGMDFKILDAVKSSRVCKLIANQHSETFAKKYRDLFYDVRNYKKIPDLVLNLPYKFREAFFMGCYGSKNDLNLSITNKGAIGSAGIFFLLKSLGYKVSINTGKDKFDTYKLTGSSPLAKFRCRPNAVKKIIPIQPSENEYIYDIQTENHHFAAGVGQIVVHNSNYISFPHISSAQELWDYSIMVAKEVTKLYPKPMNLEFEEKIYWRFFIITKKRYMSIGCERDGVIELNKDGTQKINKKGVLLQRRDNCNFIRTVYARVIMDIFNQIDRDQILYEVVQELNKLCSHYYNTDQFIITKSIGDIGDLTPTQATNDKGKPCWKVGDYTVKQLPQDEKKREHQYQLKDCNTPKEYYLRCLPAQVQLAERMRRRGQLVAAGSRLEYVITTKGGHTAKQYVKVEDSEYFKKYSNILELDYMYYLKQLANPLDQVLDIMYNKNDGHEYKYMRNFVLGQYKYRLRVRGKVLSELKELFAPKLKFEK